PVTSTESMRVKPPGSLGRPSRQGDNSGYEPPVQATHPSRPGRVLAIIAPGRGPRRRNRPFRLTLTVVAFTLETLHDGRPGEPGGRQVGRQRLSCPVGGSAGHVVR